MSVGHRLLTHWATESILLLFASLTLLAGGILWSRDGKGVAATAPLVVDGADLDLSGAVGRRTGSSLLILETGEGGRATALLPGLRLPAEGYGSVEVELAAEEPRLKLLFLWATSDEPAVVRGAPLSWSGGRRVTLRLGALGPWRGTVTAVGLGVAAPLSAPLTVRRLSLSPRSPRTLLSSMWREWTAFEGLDAHSANFVIGGSDRVRPLLRPVPAAAAWVGLALALHVVACAARGRRRDPRVLGTIVLAGWLAVDARWQVDLWRQLRITRERYAGKSWVEKRLAAEDGDLFRFVLDVKRRLPGRPQIVYVLTRDPDHADRYLQLRARYHLLPHNVCAYYSTPPPELERDEYLLVLGPRPDLVYEDLLGVLRSDADGRAVPVDRIFTSQLGTLYRRR